jgi:hypothetical protein
MKLNVYGRKFEVIKSEGKWKVFILGDEGKKRIADQITIPSNIVESELINYISDMYHEWASPTNNEVAVIK